MMGRQRGTTGNASHKWGSDDTAGILAEENQPNGGIIVQE